MRGGEIKYIAILDTNTDYKTKDYLLYGLKTVEGNDKIQDYIEIVKLYMVKFGCFNKSKNNSSLHGNQCKEEL